MDELYRVPDPVIHITELGIGGHVLVAAGGLAALMARRLAARVSYALFLAQLLAGPAMFFLVLARHRFLRAVQPNSTLVNIVRWVVFLGLPSAHRTGKLTSRMSVRPAHERPSPGPGGSQI